MRSFLDDFGRALKNALDVRIAVFVDASDGGHCMLTDRDALEVAMTDLVVDARDEMPEGGTLVLTTTTCQALPGDVGLPDEETPSPADRGWVAITVAHRARGMNDILHRDRAPSRSKGLARVYRFARENGGAVDARSSARDGTTVTLYLPAC